MEITEITEITMKEYHLIQHIIGYDFFDVQLLKTALTHSSYVNENHLSKQACNERLEFLGDAVLELVSSDFLFAELPHIPEGELTKLRASLVCEPALAFSAKAIDLGSYLLMGKGEEATGGRERDSITSDALEAVIGAIYLDGGLEKARTFTLTYVLNDYENKSLFHDSKTILQEIIQAQKGQEIEYRLIKEEGPDHNKTFYINVYINGDLYGEGYGRSKKSAEQKAAYEAVIKLRR